MAPGDRTESGLAILSAAEAVAARAANSLVSDIVNKALLSSIEALDVECSCVDPKSDRSTVDAEMSWRLYNATDITVPKVPGELQGISDRKDSLTATPDLSREVASIHVCGILLGNSLQLTVLNSLSL